MRELLNQGAKLPHRMEVTQNTEQPEITAAQLKKTLKGLSKNQLITLVLQQVQNNIEQQAANKIMLDELKRLEDKYVRPDDAQEKK